MQRWQILDTAVTPDGRELVLSRRGDLFLIQVDAEELMSSRAHGSEDALARLALEALGSVANGELLAIFHARRADDILTALRLTRELGLSPASRASLQLLPGADLPDIDAELGPPPRLRVVGDG